MTRPLFKDPELQAKFDRNGWVKVQMLDEDEVKHLYDFYHGLPDGPKPDYAFHISLDKTDEGVKRQVIDELFKVIGSKANRWFNDFQIFTGSYVIKEKDPKGIVPPHQDWSFVDETKYNSVTVWTPLVDVDMDNGCMGVINGSHKFWDYHRSSPSPQAKTPISDHMFTIFPYLQLVPMKAGESLIFDNRTIHASPPNTTDQPRIAAGIGITQKEADIIHYYMVPDENPSVLQQYAVDENFFLNFNNGKLSNLYDAGKMPEDLKESGRIPRIFPELSADDMLAFIKSNPDNVMNAPLIEKLARLFNYNLDGTPKSAPQPSPEPVAAGGIRGFIKRIFG